MITLPLQASWVLDLGLASDPEHEPVKACSTSRVAHRIGDALLEVQVSGVTGSSKLLLFQVFK